MTDQIRLKIDQRPALRCRVMPRYPTNIIGESGVNVELVNNEFVISADLPTIAGYVGTTFALAVIFDGMGNTLAPGVRAEISIPIACTIVSWRLLADQAGSIVFDIWKDTYGSYPPTVADTITAAAKPALSSANKNEDTVLTGWTKAISAGDTLKFNIDSVATITRATLTLTLAKVLT